MLSGTRDEVMPKKHMEVLWEIARKRMRGDGDGDGGRRRHGGTR